MNISFSDIGIIADIVLAVVALVTLFWYFYSFRRQKLDDKFYELLRLHRQNVEEMKVGLLVGRQSFKEMFYELGNCQIVVNNVFIDFQTKYYRNDENIEQHNFYHNFSRIEKDNLAYQIFFYGSTFNHIFKLIFPKIDDKPEIKNELVQGLEKKFFENWSNWQQGYYSISELKKENDNSVSYYRPYCGQSYWLGHYFRHF